MEEAKNIPFISVVIPVRNAGPLLGNCLESLNALDYPKDRFEVVIADGLSQDNTREVAERYGARVVTNPGLLVVSGRNIGFSVATGELVAFSDADCIMDRDWLKNSLKYFADPQVGCVGGPNLAPDDETIFGKAVSWVFNQPIFSAGSVHARVLNKIIETKSIPGCNAIYRRKILEKVMPVDEALITAEDTQMNYDIVDLGYKLLYTPDVVVWHHRRTNVARLWYQMYRYAIGRLILGKRNPTRINIMHIITGFAIPLLLASSITLYILSPTYLIYFLMGIIGMNFIFALLCYLQTKSVRVALYVPMVIGIIMFSWSFGFLRQMIFPWIKAK